ncbi:rod shape-determining protein MreD [Iamia sp. SCSIO 61187]|uniref:rod shape-determining protein MreD n=1 Tax=Iamia sp. SCSIO 61187 TaxID=2722752 RepID=UPI001C6304C2|nr:rod shape-determining protein MreD [Iamia sp. SCSIO 61187]QYG92518.1 rod shape-determining protein MreD [Iamia sp. SCSIO 61187]
MVAARLAVVALVTLVVQVVVISPLEIGGGRGNVVLLFAIAAALETDAERGALAGFASGLAFDLLLDTPTGLSALTGALVGWVVGSAKESVLRDATVIWIGLVAVASALGTLLYAGLAVVLGVTVDATALPAIVGVIAVVNVAFSKPMRWALRWAYGPEGRARDRGPSVFR